MTRSCDNCRRPVLDTDTVCWHCGYKLSPAANPVQEPASIIEEEVETPLEATPWPLIVYYSGFTLLIVIALFWVLRTLSSSPTISGFGSSLNDLVILHDPDRRFLIRIPNNWNWEFLDEVSAKPNQGFTFVDPDLQPESGKPLASLVSDLEHILQAGNPSFLLQIMRSERLNQINSEQVASSLNQESFTGLKIDNPHQVQKRAGEIVAVYDVTHDSPPIRCREMFVPGPEAAYLVSACTAVENFNAYANEIDRTFDSFQILER